MIEWINFLFLIISTALMGFFHIKRVGPAKLEGKISESAYRKCGIYRILASFFELIAMIIFILYFYYPLTINLPRFFIWDYWILVNISLIILFPYLYVTLKGVKDTVKETLFPDKKHSLYGGIYKKINHPQALGEVFILWATALLLNSPFLFLYSMAWFPIFYWFCKAEEKDLILRDYKFYIDYKNQTDMFFPKKSDK